MISHELYLKKRPKYIPKPVNKNKTGIQYFITDFLKYFDNRFCISNIERKKSIKPL